jgi:hypothetical protein
LDRETEVDRVKFAFKDGGNFFLRSYREEERDLFGLWGYLTFIIVLVDMSGD